MQKKKREEILSHLSRYKQYELGVYDCGPWWKNSKEYPHILPLHRFDANIINKGFQGELLELVSLKDRHLGIHHLNSSQALAINLFGPFVVTGMLSVLSRSFGEVFGRGSCQFEHIEEETEGTNFDFFIQTRSQKFFFEVKYTEDRFGNAKDDEHHNRKYDQIYKVKLGQICGISKEEFFKDYQLWRNILYADRGIVIFVIPVFRDDLEKKIENTKRKINRPERVRIAFVEDICEIALNSGNERFADHFIEFRKKYLVTNYKKGTDLFS